MLPIRFYLPTSSLLVLGRPYFDFVFDRLVRLPLLWRSSGIVAIVPKFVNRAISSLLAPG